jgi:hypothetical protein
MMNKKRVKVFLKSPSKFTRGIFSKKTSPLSKSISKSVLKKKKLGLFTKTSKIGSFITTKISTFTIFLLKPVIVMTCLFVTSILNPTMKYFFHYYLILKKLGFYKLVKWVINTLKKGVKWLGSKIWKGLKFVGGLIKKYTKKLLKYAVKKIKIIGKLAKKWFYNPIRNAIKKYIWAPIKRLWTKKLWVMGKPGTLFAPSKKGSLLWRIINQIKLKTHPLISGIRGITKVAVTSIKRFAAKFSMKGILGAIRATTIFNLKTLVFMTKVLKANIITKISGSITGKLILGALKASSFLVGTMVNIILALMKSIVGEHAVTAVGMFVKNIASIIIKGNLGKIASAILKKTFSKYSAKIMASIASTKSVTAKAAAILSKIMAVGLKIASIGTWLWLAWDLSKEVNKRIDAGIQRDLAVADVSIGFLAGLVSFAAGSVAFLAGGRGPITRYMMFTYVSNSLYSYIMNKAEEYNISESISRFIVKPIRHTIVGIDMKDIIEEGKKYYDFLLSKWETTPYAPKEYSYGTIPGIEIGLARPLTYSAFIRTIGLYPIDIQTKTTLIYENDEISSELSPAMEYEKNTITVASGYSGRTLLYGFYQAAKESHYPTHESFMGSVLIPYYNYLKNAVKILATFTRIKRDSDYAHKIFPPFALLSQLGLPGEMFINQYYGVKMRVYAESLDYEKSGREAFKDTMTFISGLYMRYMHYMSSGLYNNERWDFVHDPIDELLEERDF